MDMNDPLRIATYNIHGGIGRDCIHDYKRISALLKRQKIDIALLQEVETRPPDRDTAQDIADLCGGHFIHYVAAPAVYGPHGWYGNVVLSRLPILDSHIVDISVHGREPRNLIDAYIETPGGLLRVMNTHKGLKRTERRRQLEIIHRELDENRSIPLVFGGDFNDWQPALSVSRILDRAMQPHPAGATWPAKYPLMHLDRFWCRPNDLICDVHTLKIPETRIYSDHLPVIAEVGGL